MARILAFSGSNRRESFNKRLLQHAVTGARRAGAEVSVVDLKDFPRPLFDEDLEAAHGLTGPGQRGGIETLGTTPASFLGRLRG